MFDLSEIKGLLKLHLDDERLLRAQLDAMERQVPLLYFILLISIFSLSASMFGDAPWTLTVLFPAVVSGIIFYRIFVWANRSKDRVPTEMVVRKLKILIGVAVVVTVLLCGWAAGMAQYADGTQLAHIATFSVVTILSTVFIMAPLGLAAVVGVAIGGWTFVTTSLFVGNPTLIWIAISFCLVLVVVVAVVGRITASFADVVRARADLNLHNDRLEDEVKARTLELEEQALKLEQALKTERNTNEMQNQFVSMVSHEFRTPLTIIDGTARRIVNRADRMEISDIVERMNNIRASVARLSGLVERTLDASKLATGKIQFSPEAFELDKLIVDIIERHYMLATGFSFTINLEEVKGEIEGDPRLVDHIFSNLISNAIKYSKDRPIVNVIGRRSGDEVVIKIRDHGIGIPKSELPRICERFFRASTSNGIQGTGIGLNLVNELVAMHGGKMTVDSEVGQWTEVAVRLPVRQAQTNSKMNAAAEPESQAS